MSNHIKFSSVGLVSTISGHAITTEQYKMEKEKILKAIDDGRVSKYIDPVKDSSSETI